MSKKTQTKLIDYSYRNGAKKQKIRPLGNDKKSLNAVDAFTVARYITEKMGLEDFTPEIAHNVVRETTGVSLRELYPNNYCDSPLHQGLHSNSKGETREIEIDSKGVEFDEFARGKREQLQADRRKGISSGGEYHKTKRFASDYTEPTKAELELACNGLISRAKK